MASIHKQPGKPFYICSFSTWDPEAGKSRRHFKSTGTANKREAEQVCATWDRAAKLGRAGKLTADTAREIIARGVADVFTASNRESLPSRSWRDWSAQWLEAKRLESAPTTLSRYEGIVARFTDYLGKRADRDLASVTAADVGSFRDALARDLSRASGNLAVKVLGVALGSALKQGILTRNVASSVDMLKQRGECARRPFTLKEIGRVLKAAEGSEWFPVVLCGLYSGMRLGDIAALTWRNVNLADGTLAFTAKKTGGRVFVPLARPLADALESLPTTDDPDAPLFPDLAKTQRAVRSQKFRLLLADAGLAEAPGSHQSTGKGRHASRPVSELSFHSLRHSFVSFLKMSGANEATAMALAGHGTKAMSQHYTTLDDATLRAAVDRLPDVTGRTK
jgi:integrase